MKCLLCGKPAKFTESWTDEDPTMDNIPFTVYDFRCKAGHLVQSVTPSNIWQLFTLNEDGDELWVLELDTQFRITRILDWGNGPVNLEGSKL